MLRNEQASLLGYGSYAEYALALESQVHALPEHTTFGQGAGVHVPYATAYRALHQMARAREAGTWLRR